MGTIDLAYPGNYISFGQYVNDSPMLFVKMPDKTSEFFDRPIERGHFNVKNPIEWGYILNSDELGKFLNYCNF